MVPEFWNLQNVPKLESQTGKNTPQNQDNTKYAKSPKSWSEINITFLKDTFIDRDADLFST